MTGAHTVVYHGGPWHNDVETRAGDTAHPRIEVETFNARTLGRGTAVYVRRPASDAFGRFAYVYDAKLSTPA